MDMSPIHLIIAPIVIPMVIGALMLFFDDRKRGIKQALSLLSGVLLLASSTLLLLQVNGNGDTPALVYLLGNWPAPVAINLVADRLSALLLVLTSLLVLPVILFSAERWDKAGPHFHSLLQFLLMGINGAFLTGDLFNLFVFFEVMLAASYGLVLHGGGQNRVRAGLHYIAINLGASVVFLMGIAMVFGAVGTLNIAEIAVRARGLEGFAQPALYVGLAMLGLAFLVKAGMWPLCHWLVPAYSAAAGPVGAVFVALSKVGIYSWLRLSLLLPVEDTAFGSTVIFIGGIATLIFACIGVMASQSMRRAAAYFVLMSSGTLLAAFGLSQPVSTAGALFYLISSTLAASAFFMLVELLERERDAASDVLAVTFEAYGREDPEIHEEEEVGRIMPGGLAVLSIGFGVLSLVLIGLPPLSGFLAKFSILTSIIGPDAAQLTQGGVQRTVFATLLIISGLVSLVALSRMGIRIFWAPVEPFTPRVTISEAAPILLLLITLVVLTVQAGPMMDLLLVTAADLHNPEDYLEAVMSAEKVLKDGGISP